MMAISGVARGGKWVKNSPTFSEKMVQTEKLFKITRVSPPLPLQKFRIGH